MSEISGWVLRRRALAGVGMALSTALTAGCLGGQTSEPSEAGWAKISGSGPAEEVETDLDWHPITPNRQLAQGGPSQITILSIARTAFSEGLSNQERSKANLDLLVRNQEREVYIVTFEDDELPTIRGARGEDRVAIAMPGLLEPYDMTLGVNIPARDDSPATDTLPGLIEVQQFTADALPEAFQDIPLVSPPPPNYP